MKRVVVITGGLIALYLAVAYASGFGKVLREAGGVYTDSVRVLQGRG